MKKIFLSFIFMMLTGCASMHSKAGALPNAEIYVHRTPKPHEAVVIKDDKGIVKQIIPWAEVTANSAKIGNSVANIVQAIQGHFGFPFAIVPELVESSLKGAKDLKEETADQEVYKLSWVNGINNLDAELADGTKIKINLNEKTKQIESTITEASDVHKKSE